MGAWPEFHHCCGVVPLKTGTIIIGVFNLVIHFLHIAVYLYGVVLVNKEDLNESEDHGQVLFDSFVITLFIVINLCETIIGAVLLLSLNKPRILKKVVQYMTVMWLLNLIVSLVNASREAYLEAYSNVMQMLINAYFILIIRSLQLELEGRLGLEDSTYSRQTSISENFMAMFRTPPPNYDEAMRSNHHVISTDPVHCTDTNEIHNEINNETDNGTSNETNTRTNNEINNETNNRTNNEINNEGSAFEDNMAVLSITEQTTVTERRLSRQASREEQPQVTTHINIESDRSEITRRATT